MTDETAEEFSELLIDLRGNLELRLFKFPQDESELIIYRTMRDIQLALHSAYEQGKKDGTLWLLGQLEIHNKQMDPCLNFEQKSQSLIEKARELCGE